MYHRYALRLMVFFVNYECSMSEESSPQARNNVVGEAGVNVGANVGIAGGRVFTDLGL